MRALIPAGVCFAAFVILGALVAAGPLPGDHRLLQVLESTGWRFHLNRVASFPVWTALVAGASAALWLLGSRRAGLLLLLADVSAEAATLVVKEVVGRWPPGGPPGGVWDSAFPSGHVVRVSATAVVLLVALIWPRQTWRLPGAAVATVFVLLVGAARIAEHTHWPSDFLGGYLLGVAWANLWLVARR